MKTLTIILKSGAMMNMDGNFAVKLAESALKKGHKVNMFFYGEGITAIIDEQAPKRFPNLGNMIKDLMDKGMNVAACSTCANARGIYEEDVIEGCKIGSLTNDLSKYIADSDRVITLTR
ncbi:DsrE family protein [Methanothermococcus sp. Ax23]|uniref:DsrE/DsrF/TusD sulfur relay family protein n=1 Tax=Methanothermococcus sp. Ax23 TaxID=3156486 RepID=UPI003BA367AB